MPLPIGRFFRQDMPREGMVTRDLSGSCYFEALCRAPMCLQFRHLVVQEA